MFESVETMACLNILCSVERMPTDAYRNALDQLKQLKTFLASNIDMKDRKSLELVTTISMARQVMLYF